MLNNLSDSEKEVLKAGIRPDLVGISLGKDGLAGIIAGVDAFALVDRNLVALCTQFGRRKAIQIGLVDVWAVAAAMESEWLRRIMVEIGKPPFEGAALDKTAELRAELVAWIDGGLNPAQWAGLAERAAACDWLRTVMLIMGCALAGSSLTVLEIFRQSIGKGGGTDPSLLLNTRAMSALAKCPEIARCAIVYYETTAKTWSQWSDLSRCWADCLDSESDARRCLLQAESTGTGMVGLIEIAKYWKWCCHSDVDARRCLEKAESNAESLLIWFLAAKVWKLLLKSDRDARRCLAQAEAMARRTSYWCLISEFWKVHMDSDTDAARCLARAEEGAEDSSEWTAIAGLRKKAFNNVFEAQRSMERAEAAAEVSLDWVSIAEVWNESFGSESDARRCMAMAEAKARDALQWVSIGDFWMESLGSESDALRALKKAEAKVWDTLDRVSVAELRNKLRWLEFCKYPA